MAIPNEALAKLVREIETQAVVSQQQLGVVRSQLAARTRERRLLELTAEEVNAVPDGTPVYEGVGKMFIARPIDTINGHLKRERAEADKAVSALEKRLGYLETTNRNSRDHMERIFGGAVRT